MADEQLPRQQATPPCSPAIFPSPVRLMLAEPTRHRQGVVGLLHLTTVVSHLLSYRWWVRAGLSVRVCVCEGGCFCLHFVECVGVWSHAGWQMRLETGNHPAQHQLQSVCRHATCVQRRGVGGVRLVLLLPTNGVGCRYQTLLMVCQMVPSSLQQHCSSSTAMYGLPTRPRAHRQLDPPTRGCRVGSEMALVVCAALLPGFNHGQHSRARQSFGLHQVVCGGVSVWPPSASTRVGNPGPCNGPDLFDNKCTTDLKRAPWSCSRPACLVHPPSWPCACCQVPPAGGGQGGRSHSLGHPQQAGGGSSGHSSTTMVACSSAGATVQLAQTIPQQLVVNATPAMQI